MAAFDAATIALIKIDYEESSLTVAAIGEKYGVSASYISRLARERGWLLRTQRLGRRSRTEMFLSSAARALIAHRICGVINGKLDQMEADLQNGVLSSADLERDAKSIGSMIGGLEKVTHDADADEQHNTRKADAAKAERADGANDVERLQREIIERFERIQRRREAEAGSQ